MNSTRSFTDPLFEKSPYSNEAFLKLADALPDLLVHVHRADNLELLFVGRNLKDLLGYDPAGVIDEAVTGFLAEPVPFSPFQADEEARVYTLKLRHKNGQVRTFKTQVSVFERDLERCPTLLLAVSRDITGEIELAEALQQTEQLHSQNEIVFGFGSYEWDVTTDRSVWSEGMFYLFGKDPARYRDKLTYALTFSWVDPRDQPAVLEMQANMTQPGTYEAIFRPVLPDGEERWLHAKNTPVFDGEGRMVKLTGTVVDVTNEHQTLQKLRASEALLSESERLLGYGTWVWENGAVMWSDGMAGLTGEDLGAISHRPLPGQAYERYIHPDDLPLFNQRVHDIMQGRFDSFDHRLVTADGKVKWIRVRGVTTQENGRVVRLFGINIDVTEEKRLTETLLQSQRLHEENRMALRTNEALLNESEQLLHYGGWLWNVPENRHSWTDGMWELLEYPPEERMESVSANKYLQHLHPEDRAGQEPGIRQIAESGGGDWGNVEYRLITRTGRIVWVISRYRVLEWTAEGRPALIVGSTADITHLKNAQQELEIKVTELNRSNQDLEQFAYIASHDLQEPLRKISTFSNRLYQKYHGTLDDDAKVYLERMSNAAQRMQHLIDDLLEFSRIGRKQDPFQPTNLGSVARRLLSDLEVSRQEKDAIFEIEDLPVIEAIPSQIHQLFLNLFNNALKFSRSGIPSRISVSSHRLGPAEKRSLGLPAWKNYVKICVIDNGIGFEQEYAEKIFAIFQRLHGRSEYEGSGIGLAICRKIVENHNGTISAEGRPGEGASFIIILPEKQGEG